MPTLSECPRGNWLQQMFWFYPLRVKLHLTKNKFTSDTPWSWIKTNNIFCLGNTGTLSQKVCINPIVDDHLTVQYLFHQGLLGPVLTFYISAEGDGARDQMHCTVIQWKQRGFDTGSRQVQGWLVSWCFGPSQLLGLRLFHCFQAKTCANLSVLASPSYIEYNLRRFNVF